MKKYFEVDYDNNTKVKTMTLNRLLKIAIIFWLVVDALTTLGWNIKNLFMGVEL